jgi:hypothetical protein
MKIPKKIQRLKFLTPGKIWAWLSLYGCHDVTIKITDLYYKMVNFEK